MTEIRDLGIYLGLLHAHHINPYMIYYIDFRHDVSKRHDPRIIGKYITLHRLQLLCLRRSHGTFVVEACTDVLTVTAMLSFLLCRRKYHDPLIFRKELLVCESVVDVFAVSRDNAHSTI